MPFQYKLQKILEIRIRKKEEQLQAVIKAQEEVDRIELLILKNREEIDTLTEQKRIMDPMMFEQCDKFIKHLWEKDEELQAQKQEALNNLNKEKELLKVREQEVNVLDKHKEHKREEYKQEQKARELKELNEIGSQKHFMKQAEQKAEQEMLEYLMKKENQDGN